MAKDENVLAPFINQECQLRLNDGVGPLRLRVVTLTGADEMGISYSWSFRGSPRESFAPWGAIHRCSMRVASSSELPTKGWKDKFKKFKPSTSGLKVVGKVCKVTVRDLGNSDEDRNTQFDGSYIIGADSRILVFAHNSNGGVQHTFVGMPFVVDVEYREKKDTRPPGVAAKSTEE